LAPSYAASRQVIISPVCALGARYFAIVFKNHQKRRQIKVVKGVIWGLNSGVILALLMPALPGEV
jgi:hypothetical protein